MRIGSHFRLLSVIALLGAPTTQLLAQGMPASGGAYYGPRTSQGPTQALFMSDDQGEFGVRQTPYVDAYGNPLVVPAGFGQSGGCGHAPSPGYCPNCPRGFTGPMPMGAGGTDPPVGYQLMEDTGIQGDLVDQRGPHYFDVRAEAVYLTRDETFGRDINFTSLFITDNQIVLGSNQLEYDYETGFRILGRYDVGPLSVIEFGYMGVFDFESSASFTDPNPVDPLTGTGNLFSLFSEFGTNPPTVAVQGGPMPQTERSITQSIKIDSDLQTAEMTYRRYWVGYCPRVSGTILAGFRYTRLNENFLFSTSGEQSMNYLTKAVNDLYGFQTGGDMWVGLTQGLRAGAEGKVGIYNNSYTLNNTINATPNGVVPPTLDEEFQDNQVAFISEASVDLVADILPSWSIRAGYEVLFLNSVLTAGDNFNTASPYGLVGQQPRVPFVADQGQAFYHGGHLGLEYIW